MQETRWNISLFPQTLDRVVFVGYFLGAVVPLVALGVVIDRYQLATYPDRYSTLELLGSIASIAILSFGCFLMLRRIVNRFLAQLNENNRQLGYLLRASRSLASAHDGTNASESAVRSALALTNARAACVFLRSKGCDSLKMSAATGFNDAELYESLIEGLLDLAGLVMREGRPVLVSPGDLRTELGDTAIQSAIAVSLPGEKSPLGVLTVIHTDPSYKFSTPDVDTLETLAGLASVAMINSELRLAQRNFFSHITDLLVTAIDLHLEYHTGHGRRVAHMANLVGHHLGLETERMEQLHFAALLHDIGMLKIDRSTIHSSKACQKHPVFGFRMLQGIRLWDEVAPLVLYHHERFDGTGYPEGLAGEAIPLESRIISVCEAVDSMTSSTSYKTPMSFADAMSEVEANAGSQFDPVVARAFLDVFQQRSAPDE